MIGEVNKASLSTLPDNACMDWISPALLILDAMAQPLLVDQNNVKTALSELEKINRIKQTFLVDSSSTSSSSSFSPSPSKYIIPPELIASLEARFPEELGEDRFPGSSGRSSHSSTTGGYSDGMHLLADYDEFMSGHGERTDHTSSSTPPISSTATVESGTVEEEKHPTASKESEEMSSKDAAPLSTLFSLPLVVENGLTTAMCLRTLKFSMDLLEILPLSSPRASSLNCAIMQLLVHVTRVDEVNMLHLFKML